MMCSRYPLDNITVASSHLSASDPALREQSWIFEHMEIGAALVDARTGRFLKANRKFCEITGYAGEELLDRTFSDITHPDDILIGQECAQQMLAGQLHSYTVEKRYVRKNGQIIWVHATVSSLQTAGEEPGCNIAIVSDITERKLAEEFARQLWRAIEQSPAFTITDPTGAIAHTNSRFTPITVQEDISKQKEIAAPWKKILARAQFLADALEHSAQPFCIVSADERIQIANMALCELTGYTAEELHHLEWHQLIASKNDPTTALSELYRTGKARRYQTHCLRKDGSRIPVEVLVDSRRDASGKLLYCYAFITDIAELVQREAELEAANEKLKDLNRTKSQFISNVFHELRTPITTVKLYTSLLRNGPTDKRGKFLDALEQEVNRMITLVEEVLEISRIKADRSELREEAS